jgi:hypothetical protein
MNRESHALTATGFIQEPMPFIAGDTRQPQPTIKLVGEWMDFMGYTYHVPLSSIAEVH